jgi:hypothetical protein
MDASTDICQIRYTAQHLCLISDLFHYTWEWQFSLNCFWLKTVFSLFKFNRWNIYVIMFRFTSSMTEILIHSEYNEKDPT